MKRFIRYAAISLMLLTLYCVVTVIGASAEECSVVSIDNYTVQLDNITDIKEIKFAIGHYTVGSEIKKAEKLITLGADVVAKHTVDGIFTYDLPWEGEYTFWVRKNDGSQYFLYANADKITPYAESYGVKLTVKDYGENYKDLWIAKGIFNNYSEIKASDEFKYQAGTKKLDIYAKTTHDFSYTLVQPGDYTVLIRYNDGTFDVLHHELTVDYPGYMGNGLQLTVDNLKDVKCIRTAYGDYSSVSEIKKAPTHRAFTSKGVIMGADEYTIQYRENGLVTVAVQYEHGYTDFYRYTVTQKQSEMKLEENKISFGNLDGLVMIRYASGSYTTAPEIKNASDSRFVKSDAIVNTVITIDLEPGMYSFYVQYDDDSYNFYTVTVPLKGEFTKNYEYTLEDGTVRPMNYWLYTPENPSEDMPLVVVLHSSHVKSKDDRTPEQNLEYMVNCPDHDDITEYIYNGKFGDIPAYIIMPQTDGGSMGWKKRGDELCELVGYCEKEFGIDTDKVSAIGYSLGATGIHEVAASYPELFDRVLTVAGGIDGVTNYIRPYIDGKRIDIPDGSLLSVPKKDAVGEYEPERMKYAYAEEGSRYLVANEEEKLAAAEFEKERTAQIAKGLESSVSFLWAIVGECDTEVVPHVAKNICDHIPHMSGCTYLKGYSHADALAAVLELKEEIIDYICNW